METLCTNCRRESWVEDGQAGEEVVCPWCDQVFSAQEVPERLGSLAEFVESLLTEAEARTAVVADAEVSLEGASDAPLSPSRRRRRKKNVPHRALRLWIRVALGVGVVALASIGIMFLVQKLEDTSNVDQTTSNGAKWDPDPVILAKLDDWRKIDHFKFRPPLAFPRLTVLPDPGWLPRDGHFTGLRWQGAHAERAELYCLVVTFPPEAPMTGGLEQGLDRFYEWLAYRAAVSDVSRGTAEVGTLNSRTCIRQAFTCRARRHERMRVDRREGVVYVLLDANRQVTLYTLCDPALQDEHNLMGASLLTWKPK